MLLQSIKLVNFRQFLNEEIAFASGKDGKNVTIILGENGTGKTTFAQAFFWCLYGETEFSDKMILNRFVANKLLSGQSAKVSVELVLQHGENTYTITREQTYTKDGSGNIKGANTVFDILRRDKTGNTTAIKPTLRETEIKSILPKELSKYFFFDGERIERMSKDISTHKKATDFADAVRSLLGLKGMEKAIQHLNPGSKTSVIGQYEASYDASSNTRIAELTRTIEECNEKIEKLNARINELDRQIELAQTRKAQKTEELKQYEDGEKWQSQKEKLEKRIAAAKQARSNMVKAICLDFSGNIGSFLSLWMTQKANIVIVDAENDLYSAINQMVAKEMPSPGWFYLVAMELLLFTPYTQLSENDGKKYSKLSLCSQYETEVFTERQTSISAKEIDSLRKAYRESFDYLNNKTKKGVSAAASIIAITAASGGVAWILAPQIAVALGGSAFAGLHGIALVNASLAALGGGSLAAGGLGVAGGTAIIAGGGALLGVAGSGTASLTAMALLTSKGFAVQECAKLLAYCSFSIKAGLMDHQALKDIRMALLDGIAMMKQQIEQQNPSKDARKAYDNSFKYLERCSSKVEKLAKKNERHQHKPSFQDQRKKTM